MYYWQCLGPYIPIKLSHTFLCDCGVLHFSFIQSTTRVFYKISVLLIDVTCSSFILHGDVIYNFYFTLKVAIFFDFTRSNFTEISCCLMGFIIQWYQVLPIFPRLVDLPLDKFQTALANILQVRTDVYLSISHFVVFSYPGIWFLPLN